MRPSGHVAAENRRPRRFWSWTTWGKKGTLPIFAFDSEAGAYTFGYDSKGCRGFLIFTNGLTAAYGFDIADRLTSLIHAPSGGDILHIAYPQLDKLGIRLQRTENGDTTTYGNNVLYRLLTAAAPRG